MKVVKLASATDVAAADAYLTAADRLLFDTKPPPEMKGALPGGNAISFDWSLIAGRGWSLPWVLSGGLNAGNLAAAVAATHATGRRRLLRRRGLARAARAPRRSPPSCGSRRRLLTGLRHDRLVPNR